jgi:hypothetical protein
MCKRRILLLLFAFSVAGCGRQVDLASFQETAAPLPLSPGATEPSARFIFHRNHFTNLEDFVTPQVGTKFKCLGDVTKTFFTSGGDYSATFSSATWNPPIPAAFDMSNQADPFQPTYSPAFVKNVSVDITRTYYPETEKDIVQTDGCSRRNEFIAPSACADFDPGPMGPLPAPTPSPALPPPSPTPTPGTPADMNGHNFYRVRDPWCEGQGAVQSNETELSRAYVGGVNFDLDRRAIGAFEDLLMVITYRSFVSGEWGSSQGVISMNEDDHTRLRVDLIATGRRLEELLDRKQPRVVGDLAEFGGSGKPPILMRRLATLEDPYPSLKSESVLVPLSQNVLVDRIRIERIRGSYQLYQVDLYLLGNRAPSE